MMCYEICTDKIIIIISICIDILSKKDKVIAKSKSLALGSNAKLTLQEQILKTKIIKTIQDQGFKINPHVRPPSNTKQIYKKIQQTATKEQIQNNKKFLKEFFPTAKEFSKDGREIDPSNISLELKLVHPNTFESKLFRWWNLIWWSVPYQKPYGRLIQFILWDKTHDLPFGLISIQSPVLNMSIRDKALEIPKEELDYWINMSMSAQRVGALPPYNDLIGGKMVALSLTANEIRDVYRNKYKNTTTILKKRKLKPDLLFITTTSAFGKSSMYDRLRYKNQLVAQSLGYTQGSGTFHFTDSISKEIYELLESKGITTKTTFGFGPSRKIRLLETALNYLGLQNYHYHGIRREFYIFPLVHNLHDVIHKGKKPKWIDRSFNELVDFWKQRWALPRSERIPKWREFNSKQFFGKAKVILR